MTDEEKKEHKRQYYLKHKEEILKKRRQYYQEHKEECSDRETAYELEKELIFKYKPKYNVYNKG